MKHSWQTKVLLFFISVFVITNLESFLLNVVEFIVRIPLNLNSSMSNILGIDMWSKIITTTSSPFFLIPFGLLIIIVVIATIRSFDSIRNRKR